MKQFFIGVFLTVIAVIVIDAWSSGRLPSYDEAFPQQTAVTQTPQASEAVELPLLLATPALATIAPPAPAPEVEPTAVYVAPPTAIPAAPTVVAIEPTRDWTPEITAVNRNFSNAIKLYEECALDTAKAMQSFSAPPNCTAVAENLERAKGTVRDLQAQMREDGQ